MSSADDKSSFSRRRFLAAGGLAAAGLSALGAPPPPNTQPTAAAPHPNATEPFWGEHQSGILTPSQNHTYFAALDIVDTGRDDIVKMLQDWTASAARLTAGETVAPLGSDTSVPAPDSAEAMDLPPARLTLTFSFGPGLFSKDGKDRFNLASRRPEALVNLPRFNGDQLIEGRTGGDILIQACADEPQVAFHAVRQLTRQSYDVAQLRWTQSGFLATNAPRSTARNLMGFKDGTNNPSTADGQLMNEQIWVGDEGPNWLKRGSYVVMRRIRMALEHWDRMNVDFQQQTMGRCKYSGAPLTGKNEFDKPDYDAVDKDGNSIIADNSHIRLAAPINNDGAQMLRRPYSYNDGANFTAERWPPWRQEMEYDAGLLFVCYQRDPRASFIKVFEKMAKLDSLNQFVTHTGGGLFACPGGIANGEYIGQRLFEKG